MKEHKINEIIEHEEYPGIKFIVIESENSNCDDCIIYEDRFKLNIYCTNIACSSHERSDGKNVHYEYYKEKE